MLNCLKSFPRWAILSLLCNGLLLSTVANLWLKQGSLSSLPPARASQPSPAPSPELGPRHQLTYEQWVALLGREAKAAAERYPTRLSILLGDSLSLWFPPDLLPSERSWLNQGISGETSTGLLRRLKLLDQTQPETIFLMIGVNDLIRGITDDALLNNYWRILRYLRITHPQSQIVVQSILPHADEQATWEGRKALKAMPNSRIRNLNRQLAKLAQQEDAYFLDLHPLFIDGQGNLRPELTTDGLHLSVQGYWVWKSAIQLYSQMKLEPQASR